VEGVNAMTKTWDVYRVWSLGESNWLTTVRAETNLEAHERAEELMGPEDDYAKLVVVPREEQIIWNIQE
jgi:hypothetical protein